MNLVGTSLGPYRLLSLIGRGGMSTVYRAWHLPLDREVALKVVQLRSAKAESDVNRFRRESRILSRLHHPGVVRLLDCDQADGLHYFTMALQRHPTLFALVDPECNATSLLAPIRAIQIVGSLLDALEAVHREGVIHRDIKPANIFVTPAGEAILSDFGVATADGVEPRLTVAGFCPGTVLYMAPEQLEGKPADARSDVYATGLLLYRIAAGRLPFAESYTAAVRAKVVEPALPSPRALLPTLSPALESIILRACQRDPARRFVSAAEFRAALVNARSATGSGGARTSRLPRVERRTSRSLPFARPLLSRTRYFALATLVVSLGVANDLASRSRAATPVPRTTVSRTPAAPMATAPLATHRPLPATRREPGRPRSLGARMHELWPGYTPSLLEKLGLDLIDRGSHAQGDTSSQLTGVLKSMVLAHAPADVERLRVLGVLTVLGVDEKDAGAPLFVAPATRFRWVLESVTATVNALMLRRSRTHSLRAIQLHDLRVFSCYLLLVRPDLLESAGPAITALSDLNETAACALGSEEPTTTAWRADELDRQLTRHFAAHSARAAQE